MPDILVPPIVRVGDCLETMRTMRDQSVHCIVTSPPYFGLRDYGHDGQIGLESTPDAFVGKLVEVFREARRLLRDDGTLWLNLGDTYNNNPSTSAIPRAEQGDGSGTFQIPPEKHMQANRARPNKAQPLIDMGIKKKDLIGIPWRVAFALQADGWYLRQDIIWHKPNPMPESVRDRCTKAHEYLFLLSKSEKYFYDHEAVLEDATTNAPHRHWAEREHDQSMLANKQANGVKGRPVGVAGYTSPGKRNRRSVWTVATKPFKGAHFAVFPPELVEPCILAGCPKDGVVLDPFGGSGTTGGVALAHGRRSILCELNPEYAAMVPQRVAAIVKKLRRSDCA